MNPDTRARHHFDQAYSFYEAEEFDKALMDCDTAIELDPYLAEAHNLRGIVLEELDRPLEAVSAYNQAIELDSNLSEAKFNLSALKSELAARNRPSFKIVGFWRRVLAFVIDWLILSIPPIILGFGFRDVAFALGPWGRIIVYGIIFLYWGYFNSKLGGGQTIGKRVMKTTVVDGKGDYLSVSKAMLRALALVLIGLLSDWPLPIMQKPIMIIISSIIVFGGGLALLYGLIFNRMTRQGIHDLIVSSYVVKAPSVSGIIAPEIPALHKRISYGLVGLGLVIGIGGFILQQSNINPTLEELQSRLLNTSEFFSVEVQLQDNLQMGSSGSYRSLNITAWAKKSCKNNSDYCNELMKRIARIVLEKYTGIENVSRMEVNITNYFDFGLVSGKWNRKVVKPITDWREYRGK